MANHAPADNATATSQPNSVIYLTGHDPSGNAVVQSRRAPDWKTYDDGQLKMAVAYTTRFPAELNNDADIQAHDEKMAQGPMGLVSGGGTVLRFVTFAPGYECMMHRTQSLDYGIVLQGEVLSVLDSGEETLMTAGDVMVQRATMHAWKNPSTTEWARMIFCLQDCQPLVIDGKRFKEDLGRGTVGVPPSGNDD